MSIGLLLFILATIAVLIGLYGMFQKAGITPWKALKRMWTLQIFLKR